MDGKVQKKVNTTDMIHENMQTKPNEVTQQTASYSEI